MDDDFYRFGCYLLTDNDHPLVRAPVFKFGAASGDRNVDDGTPVACARVYLFAKAAVRRHSSSMEFGRDRNS